MSKLDLKDIIITEKTKKIIYTDENDEITKEEANNLLNNNSFPKKELKENNISTVSSEVKAKHKHCNN